MPVCPAHTFIANAATFTCPNGALLLQIDPVDSAAERSASVRAATRIDEAGEHPAMRHAEQPCHDPGGDRGPTRLHALIGIYRPTADLRDHAAAPRQPVRADELPEQYEDRFPPEAERARSSSLAACHLMAVASAALIATNLPGILRIPQGAREKRCDFEIACERASGSIPIHASYPRVRGVSKP